MSEDFSKGDHVRVSSERGTYRVYRSEPDKDGSILLFGGDTDPRGIQGFRAVLPEKLSVDKRKRKSA